MTNAHQSTYDSIFQHPMTRNLHWRDLRAMLASIAEMVEEPSGSVKFSRNGHTLTVHAPRQKDFSDVHELMDVRHFLERSGDAAQEDADKGTHLLVVIDHREARVYRAEVHGTVPQRIVPYDPGGFGRHLHNVQDNGDGGRKPENKPFYESVAKTLRAASEILVFGSGTGASSAMDQLIAALGRDHPDLAKRVVGSLVVDAQHLTEDQLLARAREFYANPKS